MTKFVWVGLAATLWLPSDVSGQSAATGVVLQTYSLSDSPGGGIDDIQLLTIPLAARWHRNLLEVELHGGYATGILTHTDEGYVELDGPVDTRIHTAVTFGVVSVGAFAVLPTGKSSYQASDLPLLGALGSGLLPFAIEAWGGGGAVGGQAQAQGQSGPWLTRLVAGYVRARTLSPLEGAELTYRPGNQVRFQANVDRWLGSGAILSLAASYQRFAGGDVNGAELYRPGARFDAKLSATKALGARESISVHVGLLSRSSGLIADFDGTGTQAPVGVVGSPRRRLMSIGLSAQALRDRFTVLPVAEVRVLSTGDGLGGGWLAALGGSVDYRVKGGRLGPRLVAGPFAHVRIGSAETAAGMPSRVRGWEVGLAARWENGP